MNSYCFKGHCSAELFPLHANREIPLVLNTPDPNPSHPHFLQLSVQESHPHRQSAKMPAGPRPTDAPTFHFDDVELEYGEDKRLRVKPPSFPRPIPRQDPAKLPLKKTNPLAASPQPYEFYPQDKCPVCKKDIASEPGLDFIGHTCEHRGTCVDKRCIREYYGSASKTDFCARYQGEMPLYCQAPGCGKKIEAWCYVKTRLAFSGGTNHKYVRSVPVPNPKVDREIAKAKARWAKEKRKEEEAAEREALKGDKDKRREELIKDLKLLAACLIPCYGVIYIRDEVLSY